MTVEINTSLESASIKNGVLKIYPEDAFRGVLKLGLMTGMADKNNRQLPTDEDGVAELKKCLLLLINECNEGLFSLGSVLTHVDVMEQIDPAVVSGLGELIKNLSMLACESAKELLNQRDSPGEDSA
ncbi:MAG: hypothetical protein GY862_15970 [Gammaproteobacteria bacterium]|nr:hypothetical protein [Gammaproteobacteria bacterium]